MYLYIVIAVYHNSSPRNFSYSLNSIFSVEKFTQFRRREGYIEREEYILHREQMMLWFAAKLNGTKHQIKIISWHVLFMSLWSSHLKCQNNYEKLRASVGDYSWVIIRRRMLWYDDRKRGCLGGLCTGTLVISCAVLLKRTLSLSRHYAPNTRKVRSYRRRQKDLDERPLVYRCLLYVYKRHRITPDQLNCLSLAYVFIRSYLNNWPPDRATA